MIITANNDHTLTFDSNTLARQNEAGVAVAVNVGTTVQAFGATYLSYIDFLLPDGTSYFKGPYDASGGTFLMSLGATDTILEQDGKIGIQFVVRDIAPPNSTEVWKSELKYAKILSSANATSHALTPVIPPLTFPTTFPAEDVSIADAGGYYAGSNVEDALQEVGHKTTVSHLVDLFYPVGTLYYTDNAAFVPATTWGGTWSRIQGMFIVGASDTDHDFDVTDEGGAKTVTLDETMIPAHTHTENLPMGHTGGTPANPENVIGADYVSDEPTSSATEFETQSTGGGLAHNNLPPFHASYIWKRTA